MRERIKWIDTAKGIAIILVVIGHVVQSYHNLHQYENSFLFNFTHQYAALLTVGDKTRIVLRHMNTNIET